MLGKEIIIDYFINIHFPEGQNFLCAFYEIEGGANILFFDFSFLTQDLCFTGALLYPNY